MRFARSGPSPTGVELPVTLVCTLDPVLVLPSRDKGKRCLSWRLWREPRYIGSTVQLMTVRDYNSSVQSAISTKRLGIPRGSHRKFPPDAPRAPEDEEACTRSLAGASGRSGAETCSRRATAPSHRMWRRATAPSRRTMGVLPFTCRARCRLWRRQCTLRTPASRRHPFPRPARTFISAMSQVVVGAPHVCAALPRARAPPPFCTFTRPGASRVTGVPNKNVQATLRARPDRGRPHLAPTATTLARLKAPSSTLSAGSHPAPTQPLQIWPMRGFEARSTPVSATTTRLRLVPSLLHRRRRLHHRAQGCKWPP